MCECATVCVHKNGNLLSIILLLPLELFFYRFQTVLKLFSYKKKKKNPACPHTCTFNAYILYPVERAKVFGMDIEKKS